MEPFRPLNAVALPIARPNLDTDQILPARYLQKPRANDFGEYLFRDLRFFKDESENPDFVLNKAPYRQSKIVVAERNFACGSSREHAVWALYDYGFRAAIAPSFGDIFFSNALKNGLLPIVLPDHVVVKLLESLQASPGQQIRIDLEMQTVTAPDSSIQNFDVDPFAKYCLLNGIDELDYTLSQMRHITAFEKKQASPW
jgi:3-isopropylmalate dehydratase, small subunit